MLKILKFFGLFVFVGSVQGYGQDFSISAYSEMPLSDGVEIRSEIAETPIELKVKFGRLNSGYIRGASQVLMDQEILKLNEAIVFDGAYKEGYQIGIGFGSQIPQISRNLHFDFGYSVILGDGAITAEETSGILPPGLLQGLRARGLTLSDSDLEMGLKGKVETITANIGYHYPLSRFLSVKTDLGFYHAFATSMEAEFGPKVLKDLLEDKLNKQQEDAFKQLPVLPTLTIGISYTVGS